MAQIGLVAPQPEGRIEARTEVVVETCAVAAQALQDCAFASLNRCTDFTANLELLQLMPELDSGLHRALERFKSAVEELTQSLAGGGKAVADVAEERSAPVAMPVLPQDVVRVLLRLLPTVAAMQKCVVHIDTEIRTRGSALLAVAQSISNGDTLASASLPQRSLDLIAWRLDNSKEMERALTWRSLVSGALLAQAFSALSSLEQLVDSLVLSALCAPCREALHEVLL
jgi:hypothetical protein